MENTSRDVTGLLSSYGLPQQGSYEESKHFAAGVEETPRPAKGPTLGPRPSPAITRIRV